MHLGLLHPTACATTRPAAPVTAQARLGLLAPLRRWCARPHDRDARVQQLVTISLTVHGGPPQRSSTHAVTVRSH